jgi:hypothetical protein
VIKSRLEMIESHVSKLDAVLKSTKRKTFWVRVTVASSDWLAFVHLA